MKRLCITLAILTPWITYSMEPEVMSKEALLETVAGPERAGSWVSFFEETVPGYRSSETGFPPSSRISQQLAQEVLRKRPQMRAFILSQIAVPVTECVGHTDIVRSAEFNRTGDKVVTASHDEMARIWETETGSLLHTLKGHTSHVFLAKFNPTGDKVVTVSQDRTAILWDTANGSPLHTLKGHTGGATSAVFSSTGDKVVTASGDGTAKIWETETGELLHTLEGHTDVVWSAAFNPRGDKVVTASTDGTAKIWDTANGELLHTLSGDTGWVNSAEFNPTGDKVTTGSLDGTARIWDLRAFLETEQFLAEDITLQQVALLLDIFEVRSARHYLTALKQEFPEKGTSLRPEGITFDFNKHPDLWDDYVSLPEAMRNILDPYVTKLTSEQGWWEVVNSRLYAILYWISGKLGQHYYN